MAIENDLKKLQIEFEKLRRDIHWTWVLVVIALALLGYTNIWFIPKQIKEGVKDELPTNVVERITIDADYIAQKRLTIEALSTQFEDRLLLIDGPSDLRVGESQVCLQVDGPCSGIAAIHVTTDNGDQAAVFVYAFARGHEASETQFSSLHNTIAPTGNTIPSSVVDADGSANAIRLKNTYVVAANPSISAKLVVQYVGVAPIDGRQR